VLILVGIIIFGGLAYFTYRDVFGWWKKNSRFSSKHDEPSMDAFTKKNDGSKGNSSD
jgi:hypothetical protein